MVNANLGNGLQKIRQILKEKEFSSFCLTGAITCDVSDIMSKKLDAYRGAGLLVDESNVDEVFGLAESKALRYGERYIYLLGTNFDPIGAASVYEYDFYLIRNAQLLAIVHV